MVRMPALCNRLATSTLEREKDTYVKLQTGDPIFRHLIFYNCPLQIRCHAIQDADVCPTVGLEF